MLNIPIRFGTPSGLTGRDDVKDLLLSIFEASSRGEGKLALVPGNSGIGKTALVQWLATPVAAANGLFVTGKFNQYNQNTPYYAVRQALGELWRKRASFSDRRALEARMKEALGDLGYLLADVIPEIGGLFPGGRPDDGGISFAEARHRFAALIRNFLKTVCRPEYPVVIFIDDWQWADSASLELLRRLSGDDRIRYCLVVASYRDEDVNDTHPLVPVIADLHRRSGPPEVIEVKSLDAGAVDSLIADILEAPLDRSGEFINRILRVTRGNPFHIKSLVTFLYAEGALTFDYGKKVWNWCLARNLPETVVDVFIRTLSRFEPETRELISLAACIGNRFDLGTLGLISHLTPALCRERLTPLLDEGLVLPEGNPADDTRFMFLHDRVQQAAYFMIDAGARPAIHLEIGRLLLAGLSSRDIDQRLFEILEHLNAGADLIRDGEEVQQGLALNMTAAQRAKAAIAFTAMLVFNRAAFDFACRMDGGIEGFWHSDYQAALRLHRNLAESEFLEGDKHRAEEIIQRSMTFTDSAIERAESLNILIVQYTLLARYTDAIASGRQALGELGITLPEDEFETFRDREIAQIREKLAGRAIPDLYGQHEMTNLNMLTAVKLLITLGPPCYRTRQRLWSVIVPKVVNITLDYGLVPQVGYSHTAFGGLLCWVNGDYEAARAFGALAERIMDTRFEAPSEQSVFYLMVGSSIRHWFHHLRVASEDYVRAFDVGRQSGNLQYAAYGFGHNMYCRFFQGVELSELISDTEQSLEFSRSRLNHWAIDLLQGGLLIFNALSGKKESGAGGADDPYLSQVRKNQNIQVMCIYKIFASFYHLFMGAYNRALSVSDEAEELIYTVGTQGLLPWPEHRFIRFLILAARGRADDVPLLKAILEQLRTWSGCCADNWAHKVDLASAEICRLENRKGEAVLLYDRSVEGARKNGFIQWEGMANERASRFWDELGNGHLSQSYWQQAYTCYSAWGALTKLNSMEQDYHDRLGRWYTDLNPDGADGDAFCKSHITQLRQRAMGPMELSKRQSALRIAEELAGAVNRLRVESAERRQAEADLKQTMEENRRYIAQLEQKNQELDEFTYIASHDLQEPLRKLTAFSGLLAKDVGEDLGDLARKDLDFILDSARRMEILIKDLLQLSRTGRVDIPRETVSMNRCLDGVLALMQTTFEETGTSLLRAELPEVMGDGTLLSLVFQNLIQNALKFNDKAAPVIEVTCERNGDMPVFGVKDNGIGIKPEYTRQIFQPFKRLHGRTEYPGTGIGLAICKKIVERHGGTIWVSSVFGQFTHFQFTINAGKDDHYGAV